MMGFFTRKKEIEQLKQEIAELRNDISITDSQSFQEMFLDGVTPSNNPRTSDTAMKCSAVFACVRLISGAISSSPVKIYESNPDGSDSVAKKHPYMQLLAKKPNDHITASTFWKTLAAEKVLNGNGYAAIVRAKSGRPLALIPLKHSRCTPFQAWELGFDAKMNVSPYRLYYEVIWDNGKVSILDQDDMIHVPNIGWDGKRGLSTISAGAQAMGVALASEKSASSLFEHGMATNYAIKYAGKMSPEAQEELRSYLRERHGGADKHHSPLILTNGGDVQQLSLNAVDAALIETRQFSVIDIARFFGVFPVMIGETDKTSSWGSGVEQMARWFVMFTLNDHYTDIEQEIDRKLFRNSNYYHKFDESELTRGDTKTRAEYYKAAVGGTQNPGWMTPDEIREEEGRPPIDGGSTLFKPQQGESDEK